MPSPRQPLEALLATLEPELNPGVWAYVSLPLETDPAPLNPVATFREAEGLTAVVPEGTALALGLTVHYRCAWLTLKVHSDLAAVGLTAAFATALAQAGLSCNVMAGVHHDHLFVPVERGVEALAILQALQRSAARRA